METIFLNIIEAISGSRFWLGPLLLVCIGIILANELVGVFADIQRELDE